MGMPITVKITAANVPRKVFAEVFDWFASVDARYSPYKPDSEVSRINAGLPESEWSNEMKAVLARCEKTKLQTRGYFDVYHKGRLDPSGLVKGWAVKAASDLLRKRRYEHFYIDAGGDIQAQGQNADHLPWRIGIRNPAKRDEIIKVVSASGKGVATSGAYVRGDHIYNPLDSYRPACGVTSITVIGPDVYEADRFATAAYAMGADGAVFIAELKGFEAYMITPDGTAVMTPNFARYAV
jgi:thiamine biosynthesis lipoprotein